MPEFDSGTGYLPAGEHAASWAEVADRFGWNSMRRSQLEGLREALVLLGLAGCSRVWLNDSFVTAKEVPGDFDAVWDDTEVDELLLTRFSLIFQPDVMLKNGGLWGSYFRTG